MARRKTKSKKDEDLEFLQNVLENNSNAIKEGPVKKFSKHDLKNIKPLTYAQKQMFESYFSDNMIVANGSAGTGKTFCALYLALNDILEEDCPQKKIIIIRSIVTTGKNIGALPGELYEKIAPFEEPYDSIVNNLIKRGKNSAYNNMKERGIIEFMPTTFIRGLTWNDAIVIVDEVQNLEWQEIMSVCTRIGKNSKLFLLGDRVQNDFEYSGKTKSGFDNLMKVVGKMKSVDIISFTREDIVRSGFVKEFILACEDENFL